jgi:hypothetical protein
MKKVGIVIVVLSIVLGVLSVPHKFTRASASSGPGSSVSLKIESSGFGEPNVKKEIAGDPAQVRYEYEEYWAVSYVALAVSIAGLILGTLLVRGSHRRDHKESVSNQALEATS